MNIAQKPSFVLSQRDLLGIEGLSREDIFNLLDLAEQDAVEFRRSMALLLIFGATYPAVLDR
jgi:hypothetical protein